MPNVVKRQSVVQLWNFKKKKKFLWKKCIFALLLLASKILPKNISFYNMQYTILPIIINKDLLISLKYNSVFFLWLILLLAKNYKPRLLRFFRITQFLMVPQQVAAQTWVLTRFLDKTSVFIPLLLS